MYVTEICFLSKLHFLSVSYSFKLSSYYPKPIAGDIIKPPEDNRARNKHVAERIAKVWMKSSGHHANILNQYRRTTGIGWKVNNGYAYVTQVFCE